MQVLEIQSKDLDDSNHVIADIKIDPLFRKLPKNAVNFQIWKVELDRIEVLPKSQYGYFYDDCTYIIYAAAISGSYVNQDTIVREVKHTSHIEKFIHFWLGSETISQKSGNVAYKVMELDSQLDNVATQYRETQENESARCLSYFKKGITIFSGTLAKKDVECRLFQIRGKKCPFCIEKNSVSWEHFNSSQIMLLKTPVYIFVWIGRASSLTERRNALKLATKMQENYKIPELTVVDDGYEQSMNDSRKMEWNKYLCLKTRLVNQMGVLNQTPRLVMKLYKCGYNTGKYRIEEIKTSPLEHSNLSDSKCAYIVDAVAHGVWVWIGKNVGAQEKVDAMRNARGFVKKKKYPSPTPVVRVIEGHEPVEFVRLFQMWDYSDYNSNKLTKVISKLDCLTLLQRPKLAAETQLIDDGSGERHIFCITDNHFVELPRQKHVPFFSNDCYILQYCIPLSDSIQSQDIESDIKYVLYFWSGKDVIPEIRGKCEKLAIDYFENLGQHSMMVKLSQVMETPHFLQIFGGKFVVFNGRATDYDPTGLNSITPLNFILRVFGSATYNGKAVQVNQLEVLSSKDCFVIKSPNVWVWCGQCSTGDAREVAKKIGAVLGEYSLVIESKEPSEFWNSVSEKFGHQYENGNSDTNSILEPYYFENSHITLCSSYLEEGCLKTSEIFAFEQVDLQPEDIYLLDAGIIIFIWVGALSNLDERNMCWEMAIDYLNKYPITRSANTAIALIRQGEEPNVFTGYFDSWDSKLWHNHITFDQMRMQMESSISPNVSFYNTANGENHFDKHQKYPLSILQQEADRLPTTVNPIRKEIHLTHDDFVSVFKMRFSEFDSLPNWRKQELKKKYKLF